MPARGPLALLIATKKGAFVLRLDAQRRDFALDGPHFLGHIVNHLVLDRRDRRTLLCAARTGHLGPTVFRSDDLGKSWKEASRPPAFPTDERRQRPHGRADLLAGAGARERAGRLVRGHVAAGALPLRGRRRHLGVGRRLQRPPALARVDGQGSGRHARRLDPALDQRRPARPAPSLRRALGRRRASRARTAVATGIRSTAACSPTSTPSPIPSTARIRTACACTRCGPTCSTSRATAASTGSSGRREQWERVGDHMPTEVGDIGFPIVLHPRDPDTAWVFPMDGTQVWPRTSPDGRPSAYVTRDAGTSWQRLDRGLPREQAWLTVLRQAMTADAHDPGRALLRHHQRRAVGQPPTRARSWRALLRHLPACLRGGGGGARA